MTAPYKYDAMMSGLITGIRQCLAKQFKDGNRGLLTMKVLLGNMNIDVTINQTKNKKVG